MDDPAFLVDGMLGRLARWLRLLGYDTLYEAGPSRPDEAMADQAEREGRVLVTRDRRIPSRRALRMVVLREARTEAQLLELHHALGLRSVRAGWFTRCTLCNRPLERVPREEALREAPPRVRELETKFFRCRACDKLYWMGTHASATLERLKALGL